MTPFEDPQIQLINVSSQAVYESNLFPIDPLSVYDEDCIGLVDLS